MLKSWILSNVPGAESFRQWFKSTYHFNLYNRDRWVAEEAARLPAATRVLDAGAGRGRYRPLLAHCDYKAHDFAQEPGTIGEYTPLDYVSDITAIPAESASFDAVLCTEVFEHLPRPDLALHEFARLLKPGGKVLLTAPLGSHLHQQPYHFFGGFTPYWYESNLKAAGFQDVKIRPNGGLFQLLSQEIQRAGILLLRAGGKGPFSHRVLSLAGWLTLLPARAIFPIFATHLDRFGLESESTVGYFVTATRAAPIEDPQTRKAEK